MFLLFLPLIFADCIKFCDHHNFCMTVNGIISVVVEPSSQSSLSWRLVDFLLSLSKSLPFLLHTVNSIQFNSVQFFIHYLHQ